MRPRSFSFAFKALKVASGLALITTLIAPGSALAGRSQIVKVSGVDISCELASADASGGLFAITRDRTDGGSFAFLDLFVEPNDPAATVLSGGMDDPPLTTSGLQTTFDMADDATGDVIGSASISALFTLTGAQRLRRVSQDGVQKGIFSTYSVTGTLTVTSGAVGTHSTWWAAMRQGTTGWTRATTRTVRRPADQCRRTTPRRERSP